MPGNPCGITKGGGVCGRPPSLGPIFEAWIWRPGVRAQLTLLTPLHRGILPLLFLLESTFFVLRHSLIKHPLFFVAGLLR